MTLTTLFYAELIVFYLSGNLVERKATVDILVKYSQEIRWSLTWFATVINNLLIINNRLTKQQQIIKRINQRKYFRILNIMI